MCTVEIKKYLGSISESWTSMALLYLYFANQRHLMGRRDSEAIEVDFCIKTAIM